LLLKDIEDIFEDQIFWPGFPALKLKCPQLEWQSSRNSTR